jgi:hypothetical protein
MIEPILRYVINTLIQNDADIEALGVGLDDFEIEFESIYEETENEKGELAGKKTEILIRQRDYPELEQAFKTLGLLQDDITFAGMPATTPDGSDDNNVDNDKNKYILENPLA